jgi:endonuclease YncB( thermonuclease family)
MKDRDMLKTISHLAFSLALAVPVFADVRVIDGDTIEVDGTTYRIEGIDAPEVGQNCNSQFGEWTCGKAAVEAMAALVEGREVICEESGEDGYGRTLGTCSVNGLDIGAEMVRTGMAWAFVKYSASYVRQEAEAKDAGIGVWQVASIPPWEYREQKWAVAEQEAPEGCPIKGNISDNGMIYHPPWSPWYSRTRINEARGERWFCSEAEAVAAGWRAPSWR